MIRTLNVAERNLWVESAAPIGVAANVSTTVLDDTTRAPGEIAYRYVQNCSSTILYYAFGQDASPTNFHGVLNQFNQLDCSNHRLSVSVFTADGAIVAVTTIYRNDLGVNNSFTTSQVP